MPAPAEEHLIKILRIAKGVMQERNIEQDSQLAEFIYAELISGLHKDTGTNITSKAASMLQMAIEDLEAVQFEIEAELGSFVPKAEDWGGMNEDAIMRGVRK